MVKSSYHTPITLPFVSTIVPAISIVTVAFGSALDPLNDTEMCLPKTLMPTISLGDDSIRKSVKSATVARTGSENSMNMTLDRQSMQISQWVE